MSDKSKSIASALLQSRNPAATRVPLPMEPRFAKPKQIPDWVWDQYLTEINDPFLPVLHAGKNYLEVLEILVKASPESARKIWGPLAKRTAAADEKWNSFRNASGDRHTMPRHSELSAIAQMVLVVQDNFHGHFLYSKKARARSGAAIKKYAKLLARELSELGGHDHLLPRVVMEEINKAKQAQLDVVSMVRLLEAIAQGGQAWEATLPLVTKPTQGNIKRTKLLRVLTQHFVHVYGERLSGVTLAVTRQFYDCTNINEAELSKLAPVPKRTKKVTSAQ